MREFKNRVYGIVGIKSILSNWNADFTGRPKTTSEGDIFGSDKAFKFPIKKMWENNGHKVLYTKSYIKNKDSIQPRNLGERFEYLFNKKVKDIKEKEEVIKLVFSAMDVLNFGATFAEEKNNISITGVVQVGQGYNKYKETNVEVMDILSPFRDSKNGDDANNSSIGKKIFVDEAHYMYPFTVNPSNYEAYKEVLGEEFLGYTDEAYQEFKKACLVAATAYNTNSKMGCENEFAIFIECKEDSKLYLTNLDEYIEFEKNKEEKDIIDLTKISSIIKENIDEIENVEVYYNKYTLELKGAMDSFKMKELF